MSTFSNGWTLTKLSFRVIGQDKELLLFPLSSLLLCIAYLLALLYPTLWLEHSRDGSIEWGFANVVVTFISYLGVAFIATFFNMCIVYTAKKRLEGGNATFGESLSFALGRIYQILAWATVAASVGLFFRALDEAAERAGGIGEVVLGMVRSLLGMTWSIVTLFVIPSMVYRGTGPIDAIKDSTAVLRKTWGENLVRVVGLGIVQLVVLGLGGAFFGFLFVTTPDHPAIELVLTIGLVTFAVGVIFVFTLAEMIFNTALYAYATTGTLPSGYPQESLDGAFKPRS